MEIKILTFGQITDIMSHSSLKIKDVKNTNELNKKLMEQFPAMAAISYSIAVNTKIIQGNTELRDGDTIALLPPFSGG